jgi:hypothetical protein
MKLDEIYDIFCTGMAKIQFYKTSMKELTSKELKSLYEEKNIFESRGMPLDIPTKFQNMAFTNPYDGRMKIYGKSESTINEKMDSILLHRNKQYCWLLAEAYELFEDCITYIYAYLGKLSVDNWSLSDYGNISYKDISEKDFDWFYKKASQKKDLPYSVWSRFKILYPNINQKLKNNYLRINLDYSFYIIHFLRHNIVHLSGIVSDKQGFYDKVIKKSGVYNNGNPDKEYIDILDNYFGEGIYSNTIMLLEIPTGDNVGFSFEINVFGHILNQLNAIAFIIYKEIQTSNELTLRKSNKTHFKNKRSAKSYYY